MTQWPLLNRARNYGLVMGIKQRLFGKYKGRYWWPSHTAGSEEYGTVLKSYKLEDPQP